MPTYTARTIANHFIQKGWDEEIPISPLKVIKLVYIAHGWCLAFTKRPLIRETIEAWEYGPVIPELYHAFKDYGSQPIKTLAYEEDNLSHDDVLDPKDGFTVGALLDFIWETYRKLTAIELSQLTHLEGSPWAKIASSWRFKFSKGVPIPNESIKEYYLSRLNPDDAESS